MSNSFPTYKLDLPFEHNVIGYMYSYASSFVCVARRHALHPYITYRTGLSLKSGYRSCHHGHYHETRSEAMKDLFERYEGSYK